MLKGCGDNDYGTVDRVHWLRMKARYDRWTEEVTMLKNEMKWTVLWFGTQRRIWEERQGKAAMQQGRGHQAYAAKQVHLWTRFVEGAQEQFKDVLGSE